MTMANLNITNSIDNILHLTRPRRKTDSSVDKKPPIVLDPKPELSKKPSVQVLQGLSRSRRRASSTTTREPPKDFTTTTTTSNTGKTSASLFSTLTTPPVPSLPPFIPLRSSASKQRLRFSSPADMAADPRDRRAEPQAAATSASTFSPASSKSTYLRPRFSHHYPSFFTSPAPESAAPDQVDPPRTRFSFEYHLPLHEEALTASTATTAQPQSKAQSKAQPQALQHQRQKKHAQKSSVTIAPDPALSDPSDSSDASSSARPHRLHERRSVPNFSLPHVASQSSSVESSPKQQQKQQQQQQQQQQQKRHQRQKSLSTPLAPLDQNSLHAYRPGQGGDSTSGIINALRTNATKRKRQSTIIAQQASRPFAKDAMPLSTLTYSPARSSFVADSKRRAAGSDGENTNPNGTPTRNEDIFLNIARSDSTHRDSLTRSESRRVSDESIPRDEENLV